MFRALGAYLDSIKARDPAPRSRWEVLLYPGVLAIGLHRLAHWLFKGELFFFARLINHISRFLTAIDIHPGAKIGRHLFIDHGFTVIGETADIGDNVTIYQCVTLGGTNPTNGVGGKRHPSVGKRARVGANAVVTQDVPEGATMVGVRARPTLIEAKEYQKDFVPYGTPCSEIFDPSTQKLEILQCEMEQLQKRIAAFAEERSGKSEKTATKGRDRA